MMHRQERRAAQRIGLSARARFLLRNETEGTGWILNISTGGLALVSDAQTSDGDEIVVYAEGLGRVSGRVVRSFKEGFAIAFTLTEGQRETMDARIAALVNGLPYFRLLESRTSARTRYNIETRIMVEGCGEPAKCVLVDLSRTGCRIKCDERPEIGVPVVVGALRGVVRRHTDDGLAVEFVRAPQDEQPACKSIHSVTNVSSSDPETVECPTAGDPQDESPRRAAVGGSALSSHSPMARDTGR